MRKILLVLGLLAVSSASYGANILASDFTGRVVLMDKTPIEGVKVVLHHKETNRTLTRYTNNKGRYLFANVQSAGNYTITIEGKEYERRAKLGASMVQNHKMEKAPE